MILKPGAVRGKQTVQGFSDDSSWSRGQAWALYSYTMMFRLTGYQNYLLQAGHIADMLLRRLPADGIPYWDFRRSGGRTLLSGCFRCGYHGLRLYRAKPLYPRHGSQGILSCHGGKATPHACLERVSGRTGYERERSILKHSVGALPDKSEVDVPLTYADYYFLEALLRYKNLQK